MSPLKDRVRGTALALAHAVRTRRARRLVVLVYHKLAAAPPPDDPWTISVATFERHLALLGAEGFRDLSLRDLESLPAPRTGRRVLIAFDDGYRSAAQLALPPLRAAGRRAAFFLVLERSAGRASGSGRSGSDPARL